MNDDHENGIRFTSFFTARDIVCHTGQSDRDAVIMELLTRLAMNRGIGNVKQAFDAIIAREEEEPSIIAEGIALPHARLEGLSEIVVAIATSTDGIVFTENGAPSVKLVILILAPKDDPALYLQAVSSLSRICSEKGTTLTVAQLDSAEEIWRYFERGGVILPAHVCAGDIMRANPVALQESDTLADAIDFFVKHKLVDLPVVDKDGDVVGVVTAHELLRICLPDYILWMDDVSPIINFEPFAELLRNERNTWLAEIMSQEYVLVTEEVAAIQVAKEITKHNARQAYVVRGKKLVGIITLERFLNKVLRE